MPDLVEPTADLYDAWQECRRDWGPGMHEDGFGLAATDSTDDPRGFARWVCRLHRAATDDPGDETPCLYWWIVEDGEVLGAAALRTQTTAITAQIGHVGYGIRPSKRGQGLTTWALTQVVRRASALDLNPMVLVCVADNTASARTILRCGGSLMDQFHAHGELLSRYEIPVQGA